MEQAMTQRRVPPKAAPRALRRSLISSAPSSAGTHAIHSFVQAKFRVGASNDSYEQEADRVAHAVMGNSQFTAGVPVTSREMPVATASRVRPIGVRA